MTLKITGSSDKNKYTDLLTSCLYSDSADIRKQEFDREISNSSKKDVNSNARLLL